MKTLFAGWSKHTHTWPITGFFTYTLYLKNDTASNTPTHSLQGDQNTHIHNHTKHTYRQHTCTVPCYDPGGSRPRPGIFACLFSRCLYSRWLGTGVSLIGWATKALISRQSGELWPSRHLVIVGRWVVIRFWIRIGFWIVVVVCFELPLNWLYITFLVSIHNTDIHHTFCYNYYININLYHLINNFLLLLLL